MKTRITALTAAIFALSVFPAFADALAPPEPVRRSFALPAALIALCAALIAFIIFKRKK